MTMLCAMVLFLHEPELSAETKAWLVEVDEPFDSEGFKQIKALEQQFEKLKPKPMQMPEPCNSVLSVECVTHDTFPALHPEMRGLARSLIDQMPFVESIVFDDSSFYFNYVNLISATHWDFYQDFRNGELTHETVVFHLQSTKRQIEKPESLIGDVIALANYSSILAAINLSIGLGHDNVRFAELDDDLDISGLSFDRAAKLELRQVDRYMNSAEAEEHWAYDRKRGWILDHYRLIWTDLIEYGDQEPSTYWASTPNIDGHWFIGSLDWLLGQTLVVEAYIPYLDAFRAAHHQRLVLRAMKQIYAGAPIQDHGIDAPDSWRWEWKAEELKLCLSLDEHFEQKKRVKQVEICLPHVPLELERLRIEATPEAHST
jgi:hypothetical protein